MNSQVSALYNLLKRERLNPTNVEEKVYRWSSAKFTDFVATAYDLTSSIEESTNSLFSFTANESMSGEPFPCAGLSCRLSKVDSMTRFAALYGDKVYIANPFDKYDRTLFEDSEFARDQLIGDLLVLFYVRPLFEVGLLSIRNSILCFCKDCIKRISGIETDINEKLALAYRKVLSSYLGKIRVTFEEDEEGYLLRVEGPEHIIEHEVLYLRPELPDSIIRKYLNRQNRTISKTDIRNHDLLHGFLYEIIEDLFDQNVHVKLHKTWYLSDRTDIQALASIDLSEKSLSTNAVLEGLHHIVPNIAQVPITKLIELRQKEGEAFEVYRDSIYGMLKQVQTLNPSDARQLVDDTVRPAIHTIEAKVKSSRKLLVGSLKRDLLVSSAFVGLGLFTGFLSSDVGTLIGAIGGLDFAKNTIEAIHKSRSVPEPVLDNPYYFLYKVKKLKAI